jgi:hypothetical protein
MAGDTLSNGHEYATEATNETGEFDQVLIFSPEDGVRLFLANLVRDDRVGIPLYARLRDGNNDPLPIGTSITWMFKRPGDEQFSIVGRTRDNIQPWVTLTLAEQQNRDNTGATVLALKGGAEQAIRVDDVDEFALALDGPTAIDWTNSQVYVDEQATRTVQR